MPDARDIIAEARTAHDARQDLARLRTGALAIADRIHTHAMSYGGDTMADTFRILITGSRHATDAHRDQIRDALFDAIGHIPWNQMGRVVIVHGDQHGVDRIAANIAETSSLHAEPHNARNFGPWPAAGPKRNAHMVSLGADVCLGFVLPGSRGTWDCARRATDAGIPTIVRTLRPVPEHNHG